MTPLNIVFPKITGKLVVTCGFLLVLGGCQTAPKTPAVADQPVPAAAETQKEPKFPTADLTPDLLYDILVAAVAGQRGQNELALESLSRAAYQSRDRRLIAEAIQLSMESGQYQHAIDLAQLLSNIEPENFRVIVALAKAQFGLGQNEIAINLLADLVEAQEREKLYVFHEIAALLSLQDQATILEDFTDQIATRPSNVGLAMTATILAFRLERPQEFIKLVDTTLNLAPDWEAPAVLKLTFLSAKDADNMDKFALEHLALFPEHNRFRLQYARSLLQIERPDPALEQFLVVLESNPDSEDALYSAGVLYLDRKMFDKSRMMFEHFLEIDQGNDQVRIYLSDIEREAGNFVKAINYLHGVSSDRYYVDAQIKLGRILAQRDGVESGLRHLDQIDAANEDEKTRIILEQDILLRDEGMLERSKVLLDDGLKRFPDNPDLLYNRGLLHAELDLLPQHEIDMRELIALQPENAHAYNALGYTLADKTDRLDEEKKKKKKANELLPDNPFILDSMGWVHFRLGNNDKAIKYLKQALDSRQDAEIAAHLGEVLWISGRYEEAKQVWEQGIEWAPDNAVLRDTIDRLSSQTSNSFGFHTRHYSIILQAPYLPVTIA